MKLFLVCIAGLFVLPALSSATAIFSVQPSTTTAGVGDLVALDIDISNVSDLYAFQFDITFDASILQANSVTEGAFLLSGGATIFIPGVIDNTNGTITATADTLAGPGPGVTGSGTLSSLQFTATQIGTTAITLSNIFLLDSNLQDIQFTIANGSVTVQASEASIPESGTGSLQFLGLAGLLVLQLGRKFKAFH